VRRGAHRAKDQSYMLAALTQAQLARCCFPLGEMDKAAVREKAHRIGLSVAAKPESQEICFVPDRDYARYIEARTGPSAPGPILNTRGQVLGRHRGLIHYTVGQRRGMGVAAERPLYVLRLDPARNAVIVGFAEENRCATFTTGPLHWSGRAESLEPFACLVQLRARHTPVPGLVAANASGATVALDSPQASVTPGQWAVFYEGAYVLAAGIVRDFSPAA
jgi:tRNA-specific 2-thiouridylase